MLHGPNHMFIWVPARGKSSRVGLGAALGERPTDLLPGKPPVVQKAGLAQPFAPVSRRRAAEAFLPRLRGSGHPVMGFGVQVPGDDARIHAPLSELLLDAQGAEARAGSAADIGFGETIVGEVTFGGQGVEGLLDGRGGGSAAAQLARELYPRVLARREQLQRLASDLLERLAQASTSSASALCTGLPSSSSRSLASSSLVISECSRRNWRTLSRPCPIRSPP